MATKTSASPTGRSFRRVAIDHLTSQFHQPRGLLGRLAGRIMATRGTNVDRNRWLVWLLALAPDHRVLEIGPGPGVALEAVAATVTAGEIVGLDHSSTMLGQSRKRNQRIVDAGRLTLRQGSAEDLPTDLDRFDRVYCMNVWHFWEDQAAVVAALGRLLQPEGRLAIGYQPRHRGAAGLDEAEAALRSQLTAAGFGAIEATRMQAEPPVLAVIATAPAG